jgi:hypothetical protein
MLLILNERTCLQGCGLPDGRIPTTGPGGRASRREKHLSVPVLSFSEQGQCRVLAASTAKQVGHGCGHAVIARLPKVRGQGREAKCA